LIDYKICFGHPIGHLFTYKVFFEIVSKKVLNSCEKCIEMHDFTIEIGIYFSQLFKTFFETISKKTLYVNKCPIGWPKHIL
jgi:hypothetical protein